MTTLRSGKRSKIPPIQQKYPRRFVGLAQAPILEGKPALDELRRAIKHLGLHGVTVNGAPTGF